MGVTQMGNAENIKLKKPWYKKWWVLLILIVIIVSMGNKDKETDYANTNNKPTAQEQSENSDSNNKLTATPVATPTLTPIPEATPSITPKQDTKKGTELIGSTKDEVRKLLNNYKETKSNMGSNALDFENNNLLITVFFNSSGNADGVMFLSNNINTMDDLTGDGSYVSKHYNELVKLATTNSSILIETDLTKYNSKGVKKTPMELYIGNVPH